MYLIHVIGTAGSGKTSIVKVMLDWLEDHEMSVTAVNLDPAVEILPYPPHFDIREYVNYVSLLEEGLGPNGAFIKSVDLMLKYVDKIRDAIEEAASNYVLIDTPGQMELFAFRRSTFELVNRLNEVGKSVIVYVLDPSLFVHENKIDAFSLVSAILLGVSVKVRFKLPLIFAINKVDLFDDSVINILEQWLENLSSIPLGSNEEYYTLVQSLVNAIEEAGGLGESIFVSALAEIGIDDLYAAIQRIVAGGEDYATEEPSARL